MAKNPGELPGSPSSDIVKLSDQTRATDAHASNADENIVFSKVSSSDREIARGSSDSSTTAPVELPEKWEEDRQFHNSLLSGGQRDLTTAQREEIETAPLFTADALLASLQPSAGKRNVEKTFPSYSLLAERLETYQPNPSNDTNDDQGETVVQDERLFLNTNVPWSAFICGSQGSGKSHTLSCILENALLPSAGLGEQPKPLAGLVFHYDKHAGSSGSDVCEASYLCSREIPVKVLVSPSNYENMRQRYNSIEKLPARVKPSVAPLFFETSHLNMERMKKLMAMDSGEGGMPLYMEVICKILRQMARATDGATQFDYEGFKERITCEISHPTQKQMIELRMNLLEEFVQFGESSGFEQKRGKESGPKDDKRAQRDLFNKRDQERKKRMAKEGIWSFEIGNLTIVDLSDPLIDESAACVLFNMCLSIFLEESNGSRENRSQKEKRCRKGRIVALDEAHKFMTEVPNASSLTENLLSVIRLQRHLATRVIIATQEPTLSPKLLGLCSMTIVHRFTSPDWLRTLREHLAGISRLNDDSGRDLQEVLKRIVSLRAGQALLFSSGAVMSIRSSKDEAGGNVLESHRLGMGYLKIGVRKRITADGGKSIRITGSG